MSSFTEEQIKRYSRHIILQEVGGKGQRRLMEAKILMVGVGGLGSPAAFYLAAAGIGTMGLVDFDCVDLSNLQRQILHRTQDLGLPKVFSARETLKSLNPEVEIITYQERLSKENIMDIIGGYDLVVDGCDNFPTRYLVNDACFFAKKPLVYGSIFRFEGQASVFDAQVGPCYRCLYPEPPPPGTVPSCQEAGVLGVLPGLIGTVQAVEAIKLILGIGEPLIGRLLLYDALRVEFRELKVKKDPSCPLCGQNPSITALMDYQDLCIPAP